MSPRIGCASGTRVENECPPMCISGTTQCAGSADNAAGSYLGSTLLTHTSNASQLFRVALTHTQYFASQLFRVSTLLNIHAGNARAYTVWPYISNCPTLHPMFWKGARDTKKLLGLTSHTYMCVFYTSQFFQESENVCVCRDHPGFSRIGCRIDTMRYTGKAGKIKKEFGGSEFAWCVPSLVAACHWALSVWRPTHNFLTLLDW